MILDRILACFGIDKLTDGRVVKLTHYPPSADPIPSVELEGHQFATKTDTVSIESWSVTVQGIGRFGGIVTQEVYVDEQTWNNTKIGDCYGPPHR